MAAFTGQALSGALGSKRGPNIPRVIWGRRRPLKDATEPEVKTEENVIEIVFPAAFLELPDHAEAAVAVLRESIHLVCAIHTLDFPNIG